MFTLTHGSIVGVGVNIFVLIFAALAGAIVGSLWYAIFLKGTKIVAEEKSAIKKFEGKPNNAFFASLIANLASAFALTLLFNFFDSQNFLDNAKIAGTVWLAFAVVSAIRKLLIEKKSWENFILGAGHDFVSLATMVAILTVRK